MQLNQISNRFSVVRPLRQGGLAAIDTALNLKSPYLGVFSAEEGLVDIFSFPSHLDSPGTRLEFREGRQNVCAPCAPSRRIAAKKVE